MTSILKPGSPMCSRGSPITRSPNWPPYYRGIGATRWLSPAPPDMAAPASAVTISRAAEILGEDEGLLWEMVDEMEPEDGCLWIYGTGDSRLSPSRPPGWNICGSCSPSTNVIGHPRGLERMVTHQMTNRYLLDRLARSTRDLLNVLDTIAWSHPGLAIAGSGEGAAR